MSSYGALALECGYTLKLKVLHSHAGFYIGTLDEDGSPFSRESNEYFHTLKEAEIAFATDSWTQKEAP